MQTQPIAFVYVLMVGGGDSQAMLNEHGIWNQ